MRIEYIAALIAVFLVVDLVVIVLLARRRRSRPRSAGKHSAAPILGVVFVSLGLALAAAAAICAASSAHSHTADRHADGTVVELVPSGRGSSPRYRARVEFTTAEGAHVRFLTSVSTNPPPAALNAHVDVLYNPSNPHDAIISSYWQMWFLPTLLGIISVPFLLVGGGFALFSRFSQAQAQGAHTL